MATSGLAAQAIEGVTPAVAEGTLTLNSSEVHAAIEVPYFDSVEIAVDGRVDESIWAMVPAHDNMRVVEPDTLEEATYTTHTRFLYTSKGLYVGATMEQPADTLVSRLSSRDKFLNRDTYGITLDTSGEGIFGYWFAVARFLSRWQGDPGAYVQRTMGWTVAR